MGRWKLTIDSPVSFYISDDAVSVKLRMADIGGSKVLDKGFARLDELPKIWYEIQGLSKDEGGAGSLDSVDIRGVKDFCGKAFDVIFTMSDGNPVIWQCSNKHARFYSAYAKRSKKYKLTYVGGSLAGKAAISDWSSTTGGSDDEQIIMLEQS